jgi:hypothetical protein
VHDSLKESRHMIDGSVGVDDGIFEEALAVDIGE